ncbi:hypothetical protein K438DRAFT_1845597, partial [Mycena galopus ATCC 62051]
MKAGGQGKQPKRFLDQSAALGLAESIAGIQERKSQIKVGKKHQLAQVGQSRPERSSRISESKTKLKETKACVDCCTAFGVEKGKKQTPEGPKAASSGASWRHFGSSTGQKKRLIPL